MSNPKQPWLIRYSYDPLDKLTSQSLCDTPECHRFYCKNRLTTEIQGAIGHSIVQHGDFLLAQQQRENNAIDTTLLATDKQRSVLHTLKKNTERQGIAYCPYGHRTALSGLLSLLGFNGERPDPVTGHYLLGNGYRAFNPELMRFNSPDSLSPFGKGGLNCYAYCLGDPINFGDFNGHSRFKLFTPLTNSSKSTTPIKATASPLSTNQWNFSDFLDEAVEPLSLKDRTMRNTENILGALPGHQIETLLNGPTGGSVKSWDNKTGLHNIEQHARYSDRRILVYDVIGAGLRGELNGVLPRRENEFSELILRGKSMRWRTPSLTPISRTGKSDFMMDMNRQREIYRHADVPLPEAFGTMQESITLIRSGEEIRFIANNS